MQLVAEVQREVKVVVAQRVGDVERVGEGGQRVHGLSKVLEEQR